MEQFNKCLSNPFNFAFDNGDLRKIRLHGKEIIQRIYYAVRDEEWLNIPYSISNFSAKVLDSISVYSYNLNFRDEQVDFVVKLTITIKNDTLIIETNGEALSDFKKNRIGLCVHLPSSLKETACKITHTNNETTLSVLPKLISPHQPFKDISAIELLLKKFSAEIVFEGEVFEMEDQRNWTDASYKIYSTPLELPFPVQVKKGETFYQKITISLAEIESSTSIDENQTKEDNLLPCPDIGILDLNNLNAVDKKNHLFSFVRIDFRLFKPLWQKDVIPIIEKAINLQLPIYCILYFTDNYSEEINDFLQFIENVKLTENIHSIALLSCNKFLLSDVVLEEISEALRKSLTSSRLGGGTDANFAQLNRNRPDTEFLDFIFYSIQPQEHASDELSLIENIMGQYDTVATAKSFGKEKEIDISALSFYRRFNANTHFVAQKKNNTDYKHKNTNFETAWFIGAMHQLIIAGVSSINIVCSLEEKSYLLKLFDYMATFRPEYFYSEGSLSPEDYSLISWQSKNKKHSVYANLTARPIYIMCQKNKIKLSSYQIVYRESEL